MQVTQILNLKRKFLLAVIFTFLFLVLLQSGPFPITSHKEGTREIPELFRNPNLWRQPFPPNASAQEDPFFLQQEWATNVSLYLQENPQHFKKKRILLTFTTDHDFNLSPEEKLAPCSGPGVNFAHSCEFLQDTPLRPYQDLEEFDGVLALRDWNYQFYEPRIPPSIPQFFYIQESPYTFHQGDFTVNHPILASYWRGSDIQVPYYKWRPSSTPTRHNFTFSPNYSKSRLVAIVVSHCDAYNDRLSYVRALQAFITVDVYGACGSLSCPPTEDCFQTVISQYKFYLAFENANCRDYITEKLWKNAFRYESVPVVMGAHPDDYRALAPPNSYIHVEDFASPAELAHHLLFLDQNESAYLAYQDWRGSGEIVGGGDDLFCRVCAYLFYSDFHPRPLWPSWSRSWKEVNGCLEPGLRFWNVKEP